MARRMHSEGRIAIGHVIGYSETIASGWRGYRRGVKATYRFQTHDGKEVKASRLIRLKSDAAENPLPVENTPVAVLYLDSKWHTLL